MKPFPKTLAWSIVLLLGMLSSLAGDALAGSRPSPITACGTVITASGKYVLANDLGCLGPGVLIATSKVDLDLAGHSITLAPCLHYDDFGSCTKADLAPAIATASADLQNGDFSISFANCVTVTGVRIHGGKVEGYSDALYTWWTGSSYVCSPNNSGDYQSIPSSAPMGVQIDHMTFDGARLFVLGADKSIVVENNLVESRPTGANNDQFSLGGVFSTNSSYNHISGNLLRGGFVTVLQGADNTLTGNILGDKTQQYYNGNILSYNLASGHISIVGSNNNLVQGNYGTGWDGAGIALVDPSSGNTITGNWMFYDLDEDILADTQADCSLNTWSGNFFANANWSCIK